MQTFGLENLALVITVLSLVAGLVIVMQASITAHNKKQKSKKQKKVILPDTPSIDYEAQQIIRDLVNNGSTLIQIKRIGPADFFLRSPKDLE